MNKEYFYKEVGKRVRDFRKARRLKQDEFFIDVGKSSVSEIENGKQQLSLYQYFLLAQNGFDLNDLILKNSRTIAKKDAEKILNIKIV